MSLFWVYQLIVIYQEDTRGYMEIDINLNNLDEALGKYNKEELSDDFDSYLIAHCEFLSFKNNIKGLPKKDWKKLDDIIHSYYLNKLNRYNKIDDIENYIRIGFFIIGILAILISELFTSFLSELFLIAAWVIVWELVYDLLFKEIKRRRKAKIYKYLANAKIVFIK